MDNAGFILTILIWLVLAFVRISNLNDDVKELKEYNKKIELRLEAMDAIREHYQF